MEILAGGLIAALVVQQILHSRERQTLLDRIQAPEKVLAARSPAPSDEPLFIHPEDEDALEEYAQRVAAKELV